MKYVFTNTMLKMASAVAIAAAIGGVWIGEAQAAKCLDCSGDLTDGYGEQEILPTKPLCTLVCTTLSSPSALCYIYTGPSAFAATSCGAFGVSSASTTTSAPASSTPTCTTSNTSVASSFSKSGSYSQSFGSSFIGASYSVQGSFSGKDAAIAGTSGDIIELSGSGGANATLFSLNKSLANASGWSRSEWGVKTQGSLAISILGNSVWSQAWTAPLSVSKVFTQTFFEKSYPIQLGIYTVTLKGKVSGEARLTAQGGPTTTGLSGTLTPAIKAFASATASVTIFGIGPSVEGNLTLVEISAPLQVAATVINGTVGWSMSLKAILKSLAGSLKVKLSIPLAPDPSWTIFSWSGFTKTWNLVTGSGCHKLQYNLVKGSFLSL